MDRANLTGLVVAVLLVAAPGCSPDSDAAGPGAPAAAGIPESVPAAQAVRDLVAAVTPIDAAAGAKERNDWYARRRATVERLRASRPEVGRAALARFLEHQDGLVEVRVGLLDVAAHAAPEEARPHLVKLVTEFGEDLYLRAQACAFLAAGSPATAIEVLGPILMRRRMKETYAPEDQMLAAWVRAKRALGEDPSELLSQVATNLQQFPEARHLAVRELAGTESPAGRQALEQLLVESGGNSYVRILAAQSLQATLGPEELCARLRSTLEREVDPSFQVFLSNMIDAHCR